MLQIYPVILEALRELRGVVAVLARRDPDLTRRSEAPARAAPALAVRAGALVVVGAALDPRVGR